MKRSARGLRPAVFGAGDGMTGNEAAKVPAQGLARRRDHVALGAAGIGDEGVFPQMRREGFQHLGHLRHRGGQHDHIGRAECCRAIGDGIDEAQRFRRLQGLAAAAEADDFADDTGLFQHRGERAADEAYADDGKTRDVEAHRQAFSASRKRAFCAVRPTDTRRNSGRP